MLARTSIGKSFVHNAYGINARDNHSRKCEDALLRKSLVKAIIDAAAGGRADETLPNITLDRMGNPWSPAETRTRVAPPPPRKTLRRHFSPDFGRLRGFRSTHVRHNHLNHKDLQNWAIQDLNL